MPLINQQIILTKRPQGEPKLSDFKIIESPVPDLKEGEVLLKSLYLSLDPYMRGRMNVSDSYFEPFELNAPIEGISICEVEDSKAQELKAGDLVISFSGWQKYAVCKYKNGRAFDFEGLFKLPLDVPPLLYLGALGMPGFTGYYGLMKIGEPKEGETVVVSAATGPVGSMVGQLAKIRGCRVVGIAGGPEKCRFAIEELGLDVCIDHKSKTMAQDLQDACPNGIDVYYENVGGPVFSAVLPLLNDFARVPVCGAIYWYNDAATLLEPGHGLHQIISKASAFSHMLLHVDQAPILLGSMIVKRLKFQGFIISDHAEGYEDFLKETIPLVQSGKVKVREDIIKGLEKAPEAFIGMLNGKNFGKLIVEV